jgi:ubiquinone/menaquinone biosynthesis C-methylase UbiE
MTKLTDSQKPIIEYSSEALDFFSNRRAITHASFLLPYLEDGMSILDCGCGPGTITLDLAEIVFPGNVIGIDISPVQIKVAESIQAQRKIDNTNFELGDVRNLDFPSKEFDIVFAHGMIEYLEDPVLALREMCRVMKDDGKIALRHADWGGFLYAPENQDLALFIDLYTGLMEYDGADLHFGRNQVSYLRKAGFNPIYVSASYDCWTTTPEITRMVAETMAAHTLSDEFSQPVLKLGLTERTTLERISASFLEWSQNPDAFAAEAWCEVVATKKDYGGD